MNTIISDRLRRMALDILYEDDILIAVNKPAGIVVHPTYKNVSGTLLDALRMHGSGWADGRNATIVGRLDKDTSGIVIAAKSATAHAALQRSLSAADTEKEYLALVRGSVDVESRCIALPLQVDPADRRRVIVSAPGGRGSPSETRLQRLETREGLSLLRCRLVTGRRHQIRAHLAASGWPVVGDRVYGEALAEFPRHALHAWRTSFTHPVSGQRIVIEAPIPADLRQLLRGFDWLESV